MNNYYRVIVAALLLGSGVYLGWPAPSQTGDIPAVAESSTAEQVRHSASGTATSTTSKRARVNLLAGSNGSAEVFRSFHNWMEKLDATPVSTEFIDEGLRLAQARKASMQALIRSNPEQALANALSLKEYAALPETIKPYVEKPFSERADIMVLPDESGLNSQSKPRFDPNKRVVGEKTYLTLQDEKSLELVQHGSRANILSKKGIAAQGITLDGVAAIQSAALQLVTAEDATYIQKTFPTRTTDTQHDFYTGTAIQGEPVLALAGGQVFYFASSANVERLNLKLTELEQKTGPDTGSQILFQPLNTQAVSTQTPFDTQLNQALAALNTWTEQPKSVYYIRVDFSDKPGEPITKSALETALGSSSDSLRSKSQNKTWLNASVSDVVVRMPQQSAAYTDAVVLHSAVKTAFNGLNTGINLTSYDIVGIYLPSIAHFGWAGLASVGGGNQWLNNNSQQFTLDHEFGHNYGLNHAHWWKTTDGSVVGATTPASDDVRTVDYGDEFDSMSASFNLLATFNPLETSYLNWLESSQWQTVTTSGTYRIYRFDHTNASGNRALRISRGGAMGHYWVSHRQNFDDNPFLENGAYLLWQPNGKNESWLLDTTPNSAGERNDAPIVLGRTYSDLTSNIHITPTAKGGTAPNEWLDVQVNVGVPVGNTPPNLSGINSAISIHARTVTIFSAAATDVDGDTLAYQWDFGDGLVNANTANISHQWSVGGTYVVKLTVSDMKGGTATTQVTVTVEDPLNLWSACTSNSTQNLRDIATDGSIAIAVGNAGDVLTSSDGTVWTKVDLGSDIRLNGVYYANGLWVAVGDDYRWSPDGWVGGIYTSTDAVTWTRRYIDATVSTTLQSVSYGNGLWVAVGDNGKILSSTDAVTWTPQTSGTTENIVSVAYGNNVFTAVTTKSGGGILTSADGIAWTDRSSGVSIGGYWLYYIDYLHDRFLSSGFFAGILYSTNGGISFQNKQPTSQSAPATAYGRGLFFSAGVNRPQQSNETDINLVSPDGENWSLLTTPSQPNRNAAVFFKNTFVTVGNSGSIYQSGLVSSDTTPDAFSFAAKTDVALSATVVSEPVLISGIDAATSWNVINGEACVSSTNSCSCDVGGFAASGTVTDGRYMCVRHTASGSYASNVSSTLTVGGISGSFGSTTVKNDQTIIFGSLGNKVLGDADFGISATASSGLVVTLSSQTSSVCTVATSRVHLIAAGTCTIRASQAGNGSYNPAPNVEQSFSVTPTPVNGICGNDHGKTLSLTPTALCSTGVASTVTTTTSRYDWECSGSNGGNSSTCSATRQISSNDIDGDGVSDANDGEPNDARVATPIDQQSNTVRLETNYAFQNVAIVPESTLPETGKPDPTSFDFPKGAIEYTVTGIPSSGQITVTITFADVIPSGSKVYKISSAGYQLFSAPNAIINGNTVTLTLTDGGLGDDDGRINGVIVDPVAIAEPVNNTATGSTGGGGGGGGGSIPLEWLLFVLIAYLLRYREQIKYMKS